MAEDWRDKYLEATELSERQRRMFSRKVDMLTRGLKVLSQLSQAADDKTDKRLLALRGMLRQDSPKSTDLEMAVTALEKQLPAALAARRKCNAVLLADVREMIAQLSKLPAVKPPAEHQARLARDIRNLDAGIADVAAIIAQLKTLQQLSLQQLAGHPPGASAPGLLARIFGSPRSSDSNSADTERSGGESTGSESIAGEAAPATPPDPAATPVEMAQSASGEPSGAVPPSDSARDWMLESTVRKALAMLLARVQPPPEVRTHYEAASALLSRDLNGFELAPALEHLCQVLMAAMDRDQAEIEHFLNQLNERLQLAFTSITNSQVLVTAESEARTNLGIRMEAQLTAFRSSVQAASGIDGLKLSIENNLEAILGIVTDHQREGEARFQQMDAEMAALTGRLEEMEKLSESLAASLEEQRQLAESDALTGLPNRQAYQRRSTEEAARWKRHGGPLSMVVCDLDHFKQVNDTFGHAAGDDVLVASARQFRQGLRESDFVARIGGEEFVVLMPETTASQAVEVMNKLRLQFSAQTFSAAGRTFSVTMSAGVSEFRGSDTVESVFARADRALYQAKGNGRNQCLVMLEGGGEVSGDNGS
ncbi:MAG: GGDEF domain-containing protein [Pseudomonadales bacterium]|nr:GGDEF domain-containing protein [Pseudomonadales bacterium]